MKGMTAASARRLVVFGFGVFWRHRCGIGPAAEPGADRRDPAVLPCRLPDALRRRTDRRARGAQLPQRKCRQPLGTLPARRCRRWRLGAAGARPQAGCGAGYGLSGGPAPGGAPHPRRRPTAPLRRRCRHGRRLFCCAAPAAPISVPIAATCPARRRPDHRLPRSKPRLPVARLPLRDPLGAARALSLEMGGVSRRCGGWRARRVRGWPAFRCGSRRTRRGRRRSR